MQSWFFTQDCATNPQVLPAGKQYALRTLKQVPKSNLLHPISSKKERKGQKSWWFLMCNIKASIFRNYLLLQGFGFFPLPKILHKVPNPIKKTMKKLVFVLENCLKIWQNNNFFNLWLVPILLGIFLYCLFRKDSNMCICPETCKCIMPFH